MRKVFAIFIFTILVSSLVFAGINPPTITGETKNREDLIFKGDDATASMVAKGSDLVGETCEFKIYAAESAGLLISSGSVSAVGDVCTASGVGISSLEEGVYLLRMEVIGSSPPIIEDKYFAVVKIMTQPIPEIIPVLVVLAVIGVAFIVTRKGKI